MISWEIKGTTIDLSYDYGHLLPTFSDIFESSTHYQLTQEVIEKKIFSNLYEVQKGENVLLNSQTFDMAVFESTYGYCKDLKTYLKKTAYDILKMQGDSSNPYGILVGIRPVKIVHELMEKNYSANQIETILKVLYGIREDKVELMNQIARAEFSILQDRPEDTISLYLCIPFCRTRCSYCSFPANPVDKKGHLMETYVDQLCLETKEMLIDLKMRGISVDCLYIGGGTPTALSAPQLEKLLKTLHQYLEPSKLKEFTIEAGRPDTLDKEKLQLMSDYGADRICINPQTMVNETLKEIGRDHCSESVESLFHLARQIAPHQKINMDLIAGLGNETQADMKKTVEAILKLRPDNITLHTLAIKRASKLNEDRHHNIMQTESIVEEMVNYATKSFLEAGYTPYYMYRQKQMIGNLENIGFALPESIGIYNVRIMEEKHSILALGAGAVSKLYFETENRLERFSNSKGLEDYLNRTEEMIEKKKEWLTSKYDLPIIK